MKFAAIFTSCLMFALSSPLFAQEPATDAPAPTPAQLAFLNLPEAERIKFAELVNEASRMFQQKRIFETFDKLHEAKKVFDGSPELMNLEASCYVEIRNFDRALEIYKRAEELSPDNPSIKFNIAEVYFVTKKWQESHDRFEALLPMIPEGNMALSRLVEFKLLLCKKRIGQDEEAFALANKYDFLDDSPYHYYAQAALAYDAGDTVKAEEWLAMCARIFRNPAIIAPWQDTLVEFGYIKSFYGEDAGAEP